jgi:prepilin-type N-terminal cleavage/methylation domain-containing protein
MKLISNKTKTIISKLKFTTGFTLVEMMVAIAVFSIVMVTAMSALLNVIDANSKAKSIKTAINNIHFALENISRDMRMGTEYGCLDDSVGVIICDSGNGHSGIVYKSSASNVDGHYIYYKWEENSNGTNKGQIKKCVSNNSSACDNDWFAVTSLEVDIQKLRFYVLNDDPNTTEKEQPRMVITLQGEAGSKAKLKTTFNLQTSVSQRIREE